MVVSLNLWRAVQLAAAPHPSPSETGLSLLVVAGVILVLAGLVCDVVILCRFVPNPEFRVTPKPWTMRELGITIAALVGVFIVFNVIYAALAAFRNQDLAGLAPLIIPIEFVIRLGVLAVFVLYFRQRQLNLRQVTGLDVIRPRHAAGWGAVFALAALPVVGVFVFVTNVFYRLFGLTRKEQPIVEFFLTTDSTFLLVLLVLFAVVIAPVFEEFLFRGFAYPVLKHRFGLVPALLLVSAVFALNHLHGPSLVPLFLLALGLGFAYELTGSLLTPIVMHALFNGIMVLQIFHQRALQ